VESVSKLSLIAWLATRIIPDMRRALLFPALMALAAPMAAQQRGRLLPTGQRITPLAAPGTRFVHLNPHLADDPQYDAGRAVTTVLSPDGRSLLILTSGYNVLDYSSGPRAGAREAADSNEYVFVYDVSQGRAPRQTQVLEVKDTYSGIAFSPSGRHFYVSGGDDDTVHVFGLDRRRWVEMQMPVALGHKRGLGEDVRPEAAGLAVSADGRTIVVADYENDAISVLRRTAGLWAKAAELDLRPGKENAAERGVAGGEYPYWVVMRGNRTAYVSSVRDRQIVVVRLGGQPRVAARIAVPGQPNRMILNRAGTRLYVAQDNTGSIAVIDTNDGRGAARGRAARPARSANRVENEIGVTAPLAMFPDAHGYFGTNPNALALSPDERTLYVSEGGANAIGVVKLTADGTAGAIVGLMPTGWYPNSVTVSASGRRLFLVNGKNDFGPNPLNFRGLTPAMRRLKNAANEYVLQMQKAGFQTVPRPSARELRVLTEQVLRNDHYLARLSPGTVRLFAALRQRIHHVIYIIKENRTYDQVLGDLPVGNGDAALTEFPERNTPNFHAMALDFVTLDDFECSGGVSDSGWPWSTAARTTDVDEKEVSINYADRGLSYDGEGENRNVDLAASPAERHAIDPQVSADPDLLPGPANVAEADGPGAGEAGQGNLWDAALRAGLTVRNYGFWVAGVYDQHAPGAIPELRFPARTKTTVAYADAPALVGRTDPYFRGFDQAYPDYYRYREWKREFDGYVAHHDLPNLELVRLEHDHFGNFGDALDELNTPERQIADDDYAVGLLVEAVAQSRYKNDTLICIIEDDAQDGADHVNAHRSPAFLIGPYVKHHALVSNAYTTLNMLRTIEAVLGLPPLSLNDAAAQPMSAVFDLQQKDWTYTARPSRYLYATTLPIARGAGAALEPTHSGAYWARKTRGMDFAHADRLPAATFNAILWRGLKMKGKP
jgi:DNA-binding beta-propeller fold protein YncE